MKTSKRQGFSWSPDYRESVDELRAQLRGFGNKGEEPSSTELFMLCLSFGFYSGTKGPLPPRKTDGPRLDYIQPEQMAMMKAVALAEAESSELLLDEDAVFDILEEYAAGGLMLLANSLKEANFQTWIKGKLLEFSRLSTPSNGQ